MNTEDFKMRPAPDLAGEETIEIMWSIVEQIAREQSEEQERNREPAQVG